MTISKRGFIRVALASAGTVLLYAGHAILITRLTLGSGLTCATVHSLSKCPQGAGRHQ
jgi:hypothetical protein